MLTEGVFFLACGFEKQISLAPWLSWGCCLMNREKRHHSFTSLSVFFLSAKSAAIQLNVKTFYFIFHGYVTAEWARELYWQHREMLKAASHTHNGIKLSERNQMKEKTRRVIFLPSTFTFFTIFHVNSTELSGCLHHILQFFMKNLPLSTVHKFRRHLYSVKEVFMYSSVNSLIVCGTFCFWLLISNNTLPCDFPSPCPTNSLFASTIEEHCFAFPRCGSFSFYFCDFSSPLLPQLIPLHICTWSFEKFSLLFLTRVSLWSVFLSIFFFLRFSLKTFDFMF